MITITIPVIPVVVAIASLFISIYTHGEANGDGFFTVLFSGGMAVGAFLVLYGLFSLLGAY